MKRILILMGLAATLTAAYATTLLNESFNYPDGDLKVTSGGLWLSHGGGTTPLNNAGGRAFIDQNDLTGGRDDYNRPLDASFDPSTDNLTKLYAGFTVNFSALPFNSGTWTKGSYFAHFKSSASSEFYARIGATAGVTPGTFRINIANESAISSAVEFPLDLNPNTDYLVISMLDLATDQAKLWVQPTLETDPSVSGTDAISYAAGATNAYALRQGVSGTSPNQGASGDILIDDLRVATSFVEVIPEPSILALASLGGLALLLRRRRI